MKRFDKLMIVRLMFLCFLIVSISACKKEEKTHAKNIEEIKQYLTDNNLTAQETNSGLHYVVTRVGDGKFPTVQDKVKVNYKGYLTSNEVFDESQNSEFPLSNVIEGWKEGIPKFSRGGGGYLLIPAKLGYGTRGQGPIPGGAVLIFEIDLIDF